jgi:hypothetical protein
MEIYMETEKHKIYRYFSKKKIFIFYHVVRFFLLAWLLGFPIWLVTGVIVG